MTHPLGGMTASQIRVIEADLHDGDHQAAVLALLDGYAMDTMGGETPLVPEVKDRLIPALIARTDRLILLAVWLPATESASPQFVGLMNAFEGFSTFAARPLLNIHDLYVAPEARGLGVGQALLAYAEQIARQRGYCKLTLEVLSGNTGAQALYLKQGFRGYSLDAATGQALFWQKALN